MELEQLAYTLEVPCKNEKLEISKPREADISRFQLRRRDPIGTFYYSQNGGIFDNLFFEHSADYKGPLILNSPLKVYIDLTERCNLNCRGCYKFNKNRGDIELKELRALIRRLSKCKVIGVEYLGGEPTLFDGFDKACRYAHEEGLKVRVVSNGLDLDLMRLRELREQISEFFISIDGRAEVHNRLRGNSTSYQSAILNLFKLKRMGIPVRALMTINRENYGEIPYLSDTLKKEDVCLSVKLLMPTNSKNRVLCLSKKQRRKVGKLCEDIGLSTNLFVCGIKHQEGFSLFGCLGGRTAAAVDINGQVRTCLYKEQKNMGDAFVRPFEDIWQDHNRSVIQNTPSLCHSCTANSRCGGLCNIITNKTLEPRKNEYFT